MKRHGFDPLSFVFGVLFVAVGSSALGGADVFDLDPLRPGPLGLVVVGLALAGWAASRSLAPARRRREPAGSDGDTGDTGDAGDTGDTGETVPLSPQGEETIAPPRG